jgi:hypothetical protein
MAESKRQTAYVILEAEFDEGGVENWQVAGTVQASSARAAARAHMAETGASAARFAVVAASSWNTYSARKEVQERVVLGRDGEDEPASE